MPKRKAAESFRNGTMWSAGIGGGLGVVFAALTWDWAPPYSGLITLVVVGGLTTVKILSEGLDKKNDVPFGSEGIETSFGDNPTDTILESGQHWQAPWKGNIAVEMREHVLDIDIFEELARDSMPVRVDAFIYVKVTDAYKAKMVIGLDGILGEQMRSQARLFINQIEKAEDAIRVKDELAEYLSLPPKPGNEALHDAFAEKIKATGYFTPDGIDAIKAQAGDLAARGQEYGVDIKRARIDYFDLSPEFKEAKIKKAKQKALMEAAEEQNAARKRMIKDLKELDVDPTQALASVDSALGLPVERKVEEKIVGIRGLDPNEALAAVLAAVTEILKKEKKD